MRNNITIRGQWLYPRDAIHRVIALAKARMLDLDRYEISEFPLNASRMLSDMRLRAPGP